MVLYNYAGMCTLIACYTWFVSDYRDGRCALPVGYIPIWHCSSVSIDLSGNGTLGGARMDELGGARPDLPSCALT